MYETSVAGQQENVTLQWSLQKQAKRRRHFDLFSIKRVQRRRSVSTKSLSLLSTQKHCCFGLSSTSRPALNTPLMSAGVKCIWQTSDIKRREVEQWGCGCSCATHTLACVPGLVCSDVGSKTGRSSTGLLPANKEKEIQADDSRWGVLHLWRIHYLLGIKLFLKFEKNDIFFFFFLDLIK